MSIFFKTVIKEVDLDSVTLDNKYLKMEKKERKEKKNVFEEAFMCSFYTCFLKLDDPISFRKRSTFHNF